MTHYCLLLALVPLSAADPPLDATGDPLPPFAVARLGTTRWRPGWSVTAIVYTADGREVRATSLDEGTFLFDAAGRLVKQLAGPVDARSALRRPGRVEAPDGRHSVALTGEGMAFLYGSDGGPPRTLPGRPTTAAFVGRSVVLGDRHRARAFDAATGKEFRRLDGEVLALAASDDDRTVAVLGTTTVRLWDLETGTVSRTINLPYINSRRADDKLVFSGRGRTLALAGSGHLFAWDAATGREIYRRLDRESFTALALTSDGDTLAWGVMYSPLVHRRDLRAGRDLSPCPAHENQVRSIAFSPDGTALATGSADHTVRLWRIADIRTTHRADAGLVLPTRQRVSLSLDGAVAWSPDGKLLALAEAVNEVCLRDAATGALVRTFRGVPECYAVAFSPDGRLLAAGDSYKGDDPNPRGRVHLWEVATGRPVRRLDGHPYIVRAVAFSPDGRRLAVGSQQAGRNDSLLLWDLETGNKITSHAPAEGFVDAVAFSPDGQRLLASGKPVLMADTMTTNRTGKLGDGTLRMLGVAAAPGRSLAATGADDGSVRLWDLATGTELAVLRGHRGQVGAVAFAPDGRLLASAGKDTTVLLWDVDAALRATLPPSVADKWWDDLGASGPGGYAAVLALADRPAAALALLTERAPPLFPRDEPAQLARLIRQLDDDDFDTREEASKALARRGAAAAPTLRAALAGPASEEVKGRLRRLLAPLDKASVFLGEGDELRRRRVVEVLERLGTPEARRLLASLRGGR